MSKEECRRVHECAAHETSKLAVKIERLGDKIDQVRVDVSLDRQRASSELHEKINGIAQAVARLEERTS